MFIQLKPGFTHRRATMVRQLVQATQIPVLNTKDEYVLEIPVAAGSEKHFVELANAEFRVFLNNVLIGFDDVFEEAEAPP